MHVSDILRDKGMVSIGDGVKLRLQETAHEANALGDYVLAGH